MERTDLEKLTKAKLVDMILDLQSQPPTVGRAPNLKPDCEVELVTYADKTRGASKERWDRAGLAPLVGRVVPVATLLAQGLTLADINHEIKVRGNWKHTCC